MASNHQNLSAGSLQGSFDFSNTKIAIVVAEWNQAITEALFDGAIDALREYEVTNHQLLRYTVPGTFELTVASQWAAEQNNVDAVIALGCVIMGDTPHFDYICQSVSYGLTEVNLKYNKPVIFGVLTTLSLEQAQERAGGKHGNKGFEAAITALKMLQLRQQFANH